MVTAGYSSCPQFSDCCILNVEKRCACYGVEGCAAELGRTRVPTQPLGPLHLCSFILQCARSLSSIVPFEWCWFGFALAFSGTCALYLSLLFKLKLPRTN